MTARSAFGIALAAAGLVALTSLAGACGGPALQSAPRPNPAVVAGVAAATAGALTLADPDGAARYVTYEDEYHRAPGRDPKPVKVSAPAAVLDRLDAVERRQRADQRKPPGAAAEGAGDDSPLETPDGAPAAAPEPSVTPSQFFPALTARRPPPVPPIVPPLSGFRKP